MYSRQGVCGQRKGLGQGRQRVDLWLAVRGVAYLSSSHYGKVGHKLGSTGYTERKLTVAVNWEYINKSVIYTVSCSAF